MAKEKVEVVITADDQAGSKLESLGEKISGTFDKFATLGNLLAVGIVAKGFNDLYRALEEQESALMSCQVAVENTGIAFADVKGEIIATTDALRKKTTYGDEEQQRALSRLIMMTGNYQTSLQNLPVVLDLATMLEMDLSSAARLVGMAMEGNVSMLGRYIPAFRGATAEHLSGAQAMELLKQKTVGYAQAAANSTTGGIKQFSKAIGEIKEDIAGAVIPVFKAWTDIFRALPEGIQKVTVAMTLAIPVVIALGKAIATSVPEIRALVLALTIGTVAIGTITAAFDKLVKKQEELASKSLKDADTLKQAFEIAFGKKPIEDYEAALKTVRASIEIMTAKVKELSEPTKWFNQLTGQYVEVAPRLTEAQRNQIILMTDQINKLKEMIPLLEQKATTEKQGIQKTVTETEEQKKKRIEAAEETAKKEAELENERLGKFEEIEYNIRQIGADTTTQKKNALDKEYKDKLAAYAKIKKSDKDYADYKTKLDIWKLEQSKIIDDAEAESKRQLALTTMGMVLDTLQMVVGENKTAAIALLAINKAIAISEIWKVYAANPVAAGIMTAATVAQFAIQASAISKAEYKVPEMPPLMEFPPVLPPSPTPVEVVEGGAGGAGEGGGYAGGGGGGSGGGGGGGGNVVNNYFTINFGLLTTITESQAQEIVDRLKPYLLDAEIGRG